jgi:hypothetical protein
MNVFPHDSNGPEGTQIFGLVCVFSKICIRKCSLFPARRSCCCSYDGRQIQKTREHPPIRYFGDGISSANATASPKSKPVPACGGSIAFQSFSPLAGRIILPFSYMNLTLFLSAITLRFSPHEAQWNSLHAFLTPKAITLTGFIDRSTRYKRSLQPVSHLGLPE